MLPNKLLQREGNRDSKEMRKGKKERKIKEFEREPQGGEEKKIVNRRIDEN